MRITGGWGDPIRTQELRGNVRVFCRVRPMPSRAGEAAAATFCMPDTTSLRLDDAKSGASHTFTYDRVFDAHSAQVRLLRRDSLRARMTDVEKRWLKSSYFSTFRISAKRRE